MNDHTLIIETVHKFCLDYITCIPLQTFLGIEYWILIHSTMFLKLTNLIMLDIVCELYVDNYTAYCDTKMKSFHNDE